MISQHKTNEMVSCQSDIKILLLIFLSFGLALQEEYMYI